MVVPVLVPFARITFGFETSLSPTVLETLRAFRHKGDGAVAPRFNFDISPGPRLCPCAPVLVLCGAHLSSLPLSNECLGGQPVAL